MLNNVYLTSTSYHVPLVVLRPQDALVNRLCPFRLIRPGFSSVEMHSAPSKASKKRSIRSVQLVPWDDTSVYSE